ncbi:hypothetical protein PQX77_005719 [Marasmius sp. AFHP31]|nr:hypothetical protein PQX77_005719 [Marasmius sp. AFHP31]
MSSPRLLTKVSQNGYHPTVTTIISDWTSQCSLYLLFTLPPLAFVDPYELETSYADQYAFHLIGHRGLELPVMAVESVESQLLLDVKKVHDASMTMEIPLPIHLRYGQLSSSKAYEEVAIPWPKGFMACSPQNIVSSHNSQVEPPEEFSALFSNDLHLFPIRPQNSSVPTEILHVPVGNSLHLPHVEIGTALIILACFLYLCWTSWRTKLRINTGDAALRYKKED